jgi:hypothetical protein
MKCGAANGPVAPVTLSGDGPIDRTVTAIPASNPKQAVVEQVHYPEMSPREEIMPPVAPIIPTSRSAPPADPVPVAPPVVEAKPKRQEEPPVVVALRCLLSKRPSEAVATLEQYDKTNQELLLYLLALVARLTEGSLQKAQPSEMARLVSQLESMTNTLRPHAALTIEKLCFCRQIKSFGVYQPLIDHEFRPGELVQVYAELQNFTDEPRGDVHSVRLVSRLEIREFNGSRVWRLDPDPAPDVSQSRRHDLFNKYLFQMPAAISPGLYILAVRVTDVPTGRTVERTLDFRVMPTRGF